MIARLDHVTRHQARRTARALATVGVRPMGVIVTGYRESDAYTDTGIGLRLTPTAGSTRRSTLGAPPVRRSPAAPRDAGGLSMHGAAVTRRRPVGASRLLDSRSDSWFVPASGLLVVSVGAWLGVQLTNPDAPIATPLAAAGAAGFAILVAFVLAAPMAMFTTAFALLAFVIIEPAPVDVVFVLMITLTVAARVVDPLVPGAITTLLALYVVLTLLSIVNAAETGASVRFELITLYLVALGVWLTWMFRDLAPRVSR